MYGWSIEYTMNLCRPQIRSLMDGLSEIIKMRKDANAQARTEDLKKTNPEQARKDAAKPKVDDVGSFIMALGGTAKMTKKARAALMKVITKKGKEKNA